MSVIFGIPPFDDWAICIKNLEKDNFEIKEINLKNIKDASLVIPLKYDQMKYIIDNKSKIDRPVICSDNYNTIDLLNDKCQFVKFMNDNFNEFIPKVYMINNLKINDICFPCIYKHGICIAGSGSKVYQNITDLEKRINDKNSKGFVIQEYIEDCFEYSGHLFVKNGIIVKSIYYKMNTNKKYYIHCGRMINYVREENFQYGDQLKEIFLKLNYTGFCCVDFKIKDNKIKIFEINPRFGGTIMHNKNDLEAMLNFAIDSYLSIPSFVI